jgi:hypothetical protein
MTNLCSTLVEVIAQSGDAAMPDRSEHVEARINNAIAKRHTQDLGRLLSELCQPAKSAPPPSKPAIELKLAARRRLRAMEFEGDFAVKWTDDISRVRRRIRCDIKTGIGFGGIRIVSDGASWFKYLRLLRDVIDPLMNDEEKAVLLLDVAGDVVRDAVAQAVALSRHFQVDWHWRQRGAPV